MNEKCVICDKRKMRFSWEPETSFSPETRPRHVTNDVSGIGWNTRRPHLSFPAKLSGRRASEGFKQLLSSRKSLVQLWTELVVLLVV